jgi:prepilin-type N-terminal cleavage/methylation domain-containing protein
LVSKNQSGFTLLEVMVAIVLLSFIMLAIISTTDNSQQIKDRVVADDKRNLGIHTFFSRLEWDFSHIFSPLYYSRRLVANDLADGTKTQAQVQELFEQLRIQYTNNENFKEVNTELQPIPNFYAPEKNTIAFFTASNRRKFIDAKESNFAWVQYTLKAVDIPTESSGEDNVLKGTSSIIRYFFPKDPYINREIEWENMKGQVLLDGVISLKFEFWDPRNLKFTDNIQVLNEDRNLIRGIRATVVWVDNAGFERTDVKVVTPLFPNFEAEQPQSLSTGATTNTSTSTNTATEQE